MAKKPFITLFIFLQTFFFTSHSLNQEGLSLLSWLSTFNSSSPSSSSISFSSWDQSHPTPCKWDFITCSGGDDFVAEIVVISVNLPTSFPTQILSFTKLRRLVLSRANLTGRIPGSISNLSNSLVELDLSFNSLTGGIPAEIGQLRNLQALSLNSNLLEGRIPGEIGNVSKLRKLELYDNRISGKIPAEIGELGFLEKFRAGGNSGIFGEIPPEISNCRSLVYLGLADTGISGRIPIGFGRLKNLKILSVYTARLSGSIPPELGNCSELESLFLYQNQLSGLIPRELGWLTKLRRLLLWQNNLTGSIPEVLGNVSGLEVIDLSINSLSGMIPSSFDLSHNFLTGSIPKSLFQLKNLSQLLLISNNMSGVIPPDIGNCHGLIRLRLGSNSFSGEIPPEGSLAGLLHEKEEFLDWEARYRILLGAAHGLAYLHHDCTPPIVHRDVKANNILVGQHFEAFLADFGIAKLVDSSAECSSGVSNSVAGSYGYIAPEYGYSLRITEKSDVYSYGVVLLEILTGKQPTDSQIPEGAHIVNWVNKELREKRREFTTVLDQQLVIRSGTQLQEMVQVLGVALLCVNPSPGERPTMKDVAAMLKEIKDSSNDTDSEKSSCGRRVGSDAKGGVQCSSFSRSSEALIRSP
ncbi:LRR receptor-like serine/threonine-protein kinase RGI2 [Linum perenne]